MARPLRIEYPGALYHVTSRGSGGEEVFLNEEDRMDFLTVIGEVARRMGWKCHAFCLMDNHYHLVIETENANLSKGMRQINGMYTQRFNKRHGKSGHVFQGRYKAVLVERDAYLLELCRYVVLNPIRLKAARKPWTWRWSSYAATAGIAPKPAWLDVQWLLSRFNKDASRARKAYEKFVLEGIGMPCIWDNLRHQIYLGSDAFIRKMQKKSAQALPRAQKHFRPLSYYSGRYKEGGRAMAEAFLSGGYTLAEVADHFGVHYTTVSRAARAREALEMR
jgi:REP element-mobilizing transposase RayT